MPESRGLGDVYKRQVTSRDGGKQTFKNTGAGAALSPPSFRVARSRATIQPKTTNLKGRQLERIKAELRALWPHFRPCCLDVKSRPPSSGVDSLDVSRVIFSLSFLFCATHRFL